MEGIGEGLAALAFWGFITSLIVAGVWDGAKKRQAQHETLRRMIESGKPVDDGLLMKLMGSDVKRPDRDLAIGAIVLFSVAVGLAVLGLVLSQRFEPALMPLLGTAGLCGCIAAGLLVASAYVRRTRGEDEAQVRHRPNAS